MVRLQAPTQRRPSLVSAFILHRTSSQRLEDLQWDLRLGKSCRDRLSLNEVSPADSSTIDPIRLHTRANSALIRNWRHCGCLLISHSELLSLKIGRLRNLLGIYGWGHSESVLTLVRLSDQLAFRAQISSESSAHLWQELGLILTVCRIFKLVFSISNCVFFWRSSRNFFSLVSKSLFEFFNLLFIFNNLTLYLWNLGSFLRRCILFRLQILSLGRICRSPWNFRSTL